MAIPAEASDLAVATTEFRATLDALGIAQHRVAQLFGVARAGAVAVARALGFHGYAPSEETIATAPVDPGKQRRGPGPGQPASK